VVAPATQSAPQGQNTLQAQIAAGQARYARPSSVCHQTGGEGLEGVFPPLVKSDYLMADKRRSIEVILNGLSGPIEVNGKRYDSVMPPMSQINDDGIANILTYVRNAFGNSGEAVTAEEVAQVRATTTRPAGAAH
jgi:nitrite reductase (NO-forming)